MPPDGSNLPATDVPAKKRWWPLLLVIIVVMLGLAVVIILRPGRDACDPMAYDGICVEDRGNPTILDASPLEGEPEGGNTIEINGEHFGPGVRVWFGDIESPRVSVINNIRIRALVPPGGYPHLVDIKVARGDGTKAVLTGGYRYEEENDVKAITPESGPVSGGTEVTIHGEGFAPETRVSIGGEKFQVPEYVNDTTIRVKTPPHEAGTVVVNVRTGEDELTIDDGFTYQ
jgi:hypothetical protein